ncbi:MAG: RNA polymerase sigma factor [Victivallaceae bacterium]|nr:RNA polymerase sigma factor [Victivallaceae bacterium]
MRVLFAGLIRDKLGLYRSIAIKIVNSSADADDAIQGALLRAWSKRWSFRGDEIALSSWVAKITVSESYNILRKRKRQERIRQDYVTDRPNENPSLARLDRAIAELPERYRETVHIGILSALSGEEAARQLGCSTNTLYQRIHKAKALLRETMRRMENE